MAHVTIPDTSPRVQYSVGGTSTTDFSIPYAYFDESDIVVYVGSSKKTLTTDYTITGTAVDEGYSGGTVVLNTGVTNTTVTVIRDVPAERTTDFPTNGPFNITQLNSELDKMTAQIQQNESLEDNFLRVADYDTYTDLTLPVLDDRKGTVLGFNATTGDPEAGPTIADVSTLAAITADIATLADIEDGTDDTDAIQTVAGISSNVSTVASNSSSVTTCATNIAAITAAPTEAANAATSATAAQTAQTAAETAETNAETAEANAETAQTAAEAAQAAAESARDSALSAYDNFDDRYLGVKTSDPTVDNDGDALVAGSLYFNSTDQAMKVYDGSNWYDAYANGSSFLQITNNLSDLNSASTARTNLGLGTAATTASTDYATAAQGTLADSALQSSDIGSTVQGYDADTVKKDVNNTFTAAQRGSTDTDTSNTGSVTLNFDTNQNFVLTLTGNVTLANPTTEAVGQSGFIVFIQDSTGGRTVSLGTDYETAGGAGLTLSSTASTTDVVPYIVAASGRILLGAPQLAFS